MNNPKPPSQFLALVAVIVGILLSLVGAIAALSYLGVSVLSSGQNFLGAQLGQMAAIFLGFGVGPLALYHGFSALNRRQSSPLKLPPFYFFWIVFALTLGLGSLVLNLRLAQVFLFPPFFVAGAALPVLAVVAWAQRRLTDPTLGSPISWRQAALALVSGSTLSLLVAIVAEIALSFIVYLLTAPLWIVNGLNLDSNLMTRLVSSPAVVFFLFLTALQAPIPEEFAKALCLPLFGRQRITSERQAWLIGMASGAGFAILENMLYEGVYAQYNGWSWGGVTLLRSIGAVLHPLCAGIVAVGWYRLREGGVGQLLKAYALAVGLHTLWNGGFQAFLYITGLDYYGGLNSSFNLYGMAIESSLVVFLILLSLGFWWLLRWRVNGWLSAGNVEVEGAALKAEVPVVATAQALAGWAFVCALVIVPIGAALNGGWSQIATLLFSGR